MKNSFVPKNAIVPKGINTEMYNVRMLTVNDLIKDYDAVMSSTNHLKGVFGPNDDWPTGLTIEENLIDLGWHQKEFQKKSSFAFTVMSLDETECLGCMYIYPSDNPSYDAIIIMWVRQSEVPNGLDEILFSIVKKWIQEKWPFNKVAYPGRDVSWDEFE